MRLSRFLIAAAVLGSTAAALAQDGGTSSGLNLCIDTTGQDKQPDFDSDAGTLSAIEVTDDRPHPKLRLNTNLNILDPERIILPFEQDLEALIVYDHAGNGASHTLGWFYYQDLIDRGYIDVRNPTDPNDDVLRDNNNNGVPDFHEDLYNVSAGPNARTYIGKNGARCPNRKFNHVLPDGGTVQLRDPDLLTGPCGTGTVTSYNATSGAKRWDPNFDGTANYQYPWYNGNNPPGAVVGQRVQDFASTLLTSSKLKVPVPTATDDYFSDRGLFPHIPNLLEPSDDLNDNRGLGHLVFLATDDDDSNQGAKCPTPGNNTSSNTAECLQPRWANTNTNPPTQVGPVWDKSTVADGLPDYKASAFDSNGRVRPGRDPVNEAISEEDRRVKMGRLAGNKEIVFFLVTYVEQIYGASTDSCLITQHVTDGRELQCQLWMHGDINVFFSKTLLNMDLHQSLSDLVVDDKPLRSEWLNGPALTRLETNSAYGGIVIPADQTQDVKSYNRRAAHTLVGAPRNNPLVWILGWEDQNAGGDRTYNDIVILINKQNNGAYRSDVVSNISFADARDFTITEVTFGVEDEPYFVADGGSLSPCTRAITLEDGGVGQARPNITYQVALDCKECLSGDCNLEANWTPKAGEPTWVNVPIPASDGGARNYTAVVNDLLERGFTGSQLCWRAILESPGEACQPTIANVNISYKAQRAGQYGRAAVTALGNSVVYGVYETPGRTWFDPGGVAPSTRVYDGRLDLADRGHLHMQKLYNAEDPNDTYIPFSPTWDTGVKRKDWVSSATVAQLDGRNLYTWDPSNGSRRTVASYIADNNNNSPAFPDSLCGIESSPGKYAYNLNSQGLCDQNDRATLRNWLYGWEYRDSSSGSTNTRRPWPLGGISLSTAAVIGPPSVPTFLLRASGVDTEIERFKTRFQKDARIVSRRTMSYVGTTQGYLEAVDTGDFRSDNDGCTGFVENQGYFAHLNNNCALARDYGSGDEKFAYLPYKLLPFYVENFRREGTVDSRATLDASPAVADIDLGNGDSEYDAKNGYTPTDSNQWKLNTADPKKGAKTALVSATGPKQSVFFALDITDPSDASTYPTPLWELDVKRDKFDSSNGTNAGTSCTGGGSCKFIPELFTGGLAKPDTTGSRHAPTLARMNFGGTTGGKKWVAAFATDYVPASGTVGTVYLVDMKTGLPVQVPGSSNIKAQLAGVVTLGGTGDANEGIGGEVAALDLDGDSNVDVLYVPSTSGKIYRINLDDVNTSRSLGKVIASCVVADAKTAPGVDAADKPFQRIFSSISVRKQQGNNGSTVRIYFGTANSPDNSSEPEDKALPADRPHYYVLAYDDLTPRGACGATQAWAQKLDDGQLVWGGVASSPDGVFTTTASGKAANVCGLDSQSGKLYAYSSSGSAKAVSGTDLGGHGIHAPVLHDNQLIILTADAHPIVAGNQKFNNQDGIGQGRKSSVLIWDVRPGADIKQVVP